MASVLFVDDDPLMLSTLRRILRREPCEVLTAVSPAEALALLAERPVDVIVSDQRMATMAGDELLAKVRVLFPDTVQIMLTGGADLSTSSRIIARGELYRYLTKPFDPSELVQTLRQAFARKRLTDETKRLRVSSETLPAVRQARRAG